MKSNCFSLCGEITSLNNPIIEPIIRSGQKMLAHESHNYLESVSQRSGSFFNSTLQLLPCGYVHALRCYQIQCLLIVRVIWKVKFQSFLQTGTSQSQSVRALLKYYTLTLLAHYDYCLTRNSGDTSEYLTKATKYDEYMKDQCIQSCIFWREHRT